MSSSKRAKKGKMFPGERIKQIRMALGLTQAEFAKKLGTKQRTVSNWERGRNEPSLHMLAKFSSLWAIN